VNILDFGALLIKTEDLDPVYCGLYRAKLPEPQLCRLLLAYLSFYHLGVSAWMSEHEGGNFWDWMEKAAVNETPAPSGGRWPRSSERRHFRGQKCVNAVRWLAEHYAPETPVRLLAKLPTEKLIIAQVCKWPMFSTWAGFKAADLMERVYGAPVKFNPNIGLMYESPRAALNQLVVDHSFIAPEALYNNLMTYFSETKAPPRFDRYCNCQEVETVLCKFGSMRHGKYWVGKDISEVREALHGWGETAHQILNSMPSEVARA
jgi:hypothetical protein